MSDLIDAVFIFSFIRHVCENKMEMRIPVLPPQCANLILKYS